MDKDINVLLLEIKDDIKNLTEENSDELLNRIKVNFLELMEYIKLFLISERNTYYGYFLMNMVFNVNFKADIIAGIRLNSVPPIFDSNPLNLCRFKLKEIIYVVCHEIEHIVLNHPAEMLKSNPKKDPELFHKFNLAADAAVNDRLDSENCKFFQRPDGAITSEVLGNQFNIKHIRKLENYLYYYNLIKDLDSDAANSSPQAMLSNIGGEPFEDAKGDSSYVVSNQESDISDHSWDDGDDTFDVSDLVKEYVNSTYSMMNEEARGLMPASFTQQINIINKPNTLSWKQILKKYIGTVVAGKRKTRTRLNRRQPERFDISGKVDEKIIKIVVAIDTSGSVSNEEISDIFNEIFSILATRKHEIIIIECDAEIQRVYKAKNKSDIKTKVTGRGGTEFTPVINYINNDRYFRDALLVYFTDGGGEYAIPKPLTYRNIWVLTGDYSLSIEKPYGIVLKMENE